MRNLNEFPRGQRKPWSLLRNTTRCHMRARTRHQCGMGASSLRDLVGCALLTCARHLRGPPLQPLGCAFADLEQLRGHQPRLLGKLETISQRNNKLNLQTPTRLQAGNLLGQTLQRGIPARSAQPQPAECAPKQQRLAREREPVSSTARSCMLPSVLVSC